MGRTWKNTEKYISQQYKFKGVKKEPNKKDYNDIETN